MAPESLPTASVLFGNQAALDLARAALSLKFGECLACSDPLPFTYTPYYLDEVGPNPCKLFMVFPPCERGADLAAWKRWSSAEEARICSALGTGRARVANIDPGALAMGSLTLASTKEAAHRSWVSDGIWAQLELLWRRGNFVPMDWTYRDYREPAVIEFFAAARKVLAGMRKAACRSAIDRADRMPLE